MALTGFNPDVVNSSINSVKQSYEKLINILGDEMQNQFVVGMSDKWACADAQAFFNDAFKPAIDNLITCINVTFGDVFTAMNQAAQAWTMNTDATFSPVSFSAIDKKIDTSIIRENIDGIRGIDLATASDVAAKLLTISDNAQQALTSAQQAVEDCGFVGGNQASSLIATLGVIKSKISTASQEISSEAKRAIDGTVARYSNTEGKISEAFSAQ